MPPLAPSGPAVSLSEVLAALSHALDLTEGQPMGHTIRSCLIGMRMAEAIGLDAQERSALYYALLLKDAGCSSNAARMAALFGADDRSVKPRLTAVDWQNRFRLALATARISGSGRGPVERIRRFLAIARTEGVTRDLISVRCERGAGIARRLGFPDSTASAVRSLDEHWCGLGHPEGLVGEDIPLLARICSIAQTVERFQAAEGTKAALEVIRARRGSWFDPRLVDVVLSWKRDTDWWWSLRGDEANAMVMRAEPADRVATADEARLREVALAFADIIDAKSPFTFRHSERVAGYAVMLARRLGADGATIDRLYLAGLLHDIGKLGVSNAILDKPGKLTDDERVQIEQHPRHTLSILLRVTAFGHFAWMAAVHHEKLDGSGYPWGLGAAQLDVPSRVLAVADIYDALRSDRPYRVGMSHEDAMALLRRDAGTRLCPDVIGVMDTPLPEPAAGVFPESGFAAAPAVTSRAMT